MSADPMMCKKSLFPCRAQSFGLQLLLILRRRRDNEPIVVVIGDELVESTSRCHRHFLATQQNPKSREQKINNESAVSSPLLVEMKMEIP